MSAMPEYDATAGFPKEHVGAFGKVAADLKLVVSSRELNPMCTDLVLESYAAKGFHIKAKTCEWGPMAGFVLEDPRFTKASQDAKKQQEDIEKAFKDGSYCVPVFVSNARLEKLAARNVITRQPGPNGAVKVTATPTGASTSYEFILVKTAAAPAGASEPMWGVYYAPTLRPIRAAARKPLLINAPLESGLEPVTGMVNGENGDGKLGVRSAVAGDYDLWCIFPSDSTPDIGLGIRSMPLRATIAPTAGPWVKQQAAAAGLVFSSPAQKLQMAAKQEDKHLGNISLGVMKVRARLNEACQGAGYKAGNVVQHSDYGGNPFGTIDYPLIFFIPKLPSTQVEVKVARDLNSLKDILRLITKYGFHVKLNPAWSVPSF